MGSRKNSFPPIDSVHWDGESLTSEKNAVDSQRSFFFPSLADTCCPMARLGKKRSIPEIQRIILPSVRMESSCRRRHSPAQRESPPKNPTSPASRGAKAIPAQRERRSRRAYRPQSGKMRADRPLRRAADKAHDMRQRRPPPHGQGEYGGRRGCRGARPSHPLPPAA